MYSELCVLKAMQIYKGFTALSRENILHKSKNALWGKNIGNKEINIGF